MAEARGRVVRYLTLLEIVELHTRIAAQSGGARGVRDLAALESAVSQPRASFAGEDLYGDLAAKASALGHALIANHPFVDGNKRVGHAAMEVFLMLNGYELSAGVDEAERTILDAASGRLGREQLATWVRESLRAL